MLYSSVANTRDVRFNVDTIDFGFSHSGRISEGRGVTLHNNYCFPVKINWHLMQVYDKTSEKLVKNPFRVVPAEFEMSPNSSQTFQCEFSPYEPDSYFF
jgi:hypothetical protein